MRIRNHISGILAIPFFGLMACSKHHGDLEENLPVAVISFFSPTQGAIFKNGDSVHIKAQAYSTQTIHGYDIVIRELGDTAKIYFRNVHDHKDTLMIDQKWASATGGRLNLEAEIKLYLDHDGHTKKSSVAFRVN
jgi:hypothetical protein